MANGTENGTGADTGVAYKHETRRKLQKPRRYKVLLHNDDFTTMEFVVSILMGIFRKSQPDAVAVMLQVHKSGHGVAGVYTREIADSKVAEVTALARQAEYPLLCTAEPDEDSGSENTGNGS